MTLKGFSRGGWRVAACAAALASAIAAPALAAEGQGQPVDWQMHFQPAVTPIAEQIHGFHDLLLVIIAIITIFVAGLLVWVAVRYNAKANPTPSRNSHNTTLEVAWTIVPVLILLVIAIPSFRLLYAQYDFPKADLTIKATGHQWYWSYNYPDHGNFNYDSLMVEDKDLKPGQPRLLAVDNEVVVPVNKVVHLLLAADDVIHNWTVPAFGVKVDAVPGRVTRLWFQAREPGVYYGQCSELCGERHAFMPIAVRVVSDQEFAAWVEDAKKKFASNDAAPKPALAAAGDDDGKGQATGLQLAIAEQQ
jgi:cytochrome c oxidase subunit II